MDSKAVYKSAMVLVLQNMDIFMGDISIISSFLFLVGFEKYS